VSAACPLCHTTGASLLTRGSDLEYHTLPETTFAMWRCAACGHGFLDPLPGPAQLPEIYPPTYYTVNPDSPVHFADRLRRLKLRRDVGRVLALTRGREIHSVVDLGCGDGERLARLGEVLPGDLELLGLDLQPDPARAEELARRGVRVLEANLEEELGGLRDDGHDLVIMSQILEHLRDPVAVLRNVARKLTPGGCVLIETPNLGGLDFRLFHRRYWGAYHIPRHFHLFSRATLGAAVGRAGLRVVRRGFLPGGFFIVSLRSALGLDSVARSGRFGEFLNMRNLPVVAFFSALDMLAIAAGRETSNQFVLAEK
jgi:SAM-dependent methyltransferase